MDPCFYTPLRQMFNAYLRVRPHDGDYHFYTPPELAALPERHAWIRVRWRRLNATFFVVVSAKAEGGEVARC